MKGENRKKLKNVYSKWAKKSPYKTLQLVKCFARDLSVRESARITKMSERTVRDRFAEIRGKLLSWVMEYPDRFNGFGHLLLDPDGSMNTHVLEVLVYQSKTESFTQRMAERYPRFRTENDPSLQHVIEQAVRSFTATEPSETNQNFSEFVKDAFSASKTETYLLSLERKSASFRGRLQRWRIFRRKITSQKEYKARSFPNADGEAFLRDLKYCLRRDPN